MAALSDEVKVLVVDDQRAVLDALKVLFDLHDIPCVCAGDPAEALRVAGSQRIGLVVQDMNFRPDETTGEEGVRLFRRLRAQDPELPVLLITAWASVESAVELIKEGAADYVAKPWDNDKLVATVQELLDARRARMAERSQRREGRRARAELAERHDLCGIIFESDALLEAVSLAVNVAPSDAPILVTGPSGAGKEKLAEIVQANSSRSTAPFLRVNVGAIPEDLIESELFGAEAGAFTGARGSRAGLFEAADGGTLFLDEVDALSLAGQVKLLRVAQSGEYQRLGSTRPRRADVRILSATNADLAGLVEDGRFREDLYYRLNVIELRVPGLADRPEDILPLAEAFLAREETSPRRLSVAARRQLAGHSFSGNVRELENRIRRAALTARGEEIAPEDLGLGDAARTPPPVDDPERSLIEEALIDAEGNVSRVAERLGLSRQALYRKMEKLGIVLERRPRD